MRRQFWSSYVERPNYKTNFNTGCKYSDEINVNFFLFVFEDLAQKEIDVEELNVG
jgi:hypothetical protein